MKNEIRFTLESKQRPKLAQEIGNLLGTAPHYERVPSCAYDIAGYRVKPFSLRLAAIFAPTIADNFCAFLRDTSSTPFLSEKRYGVFFTCCPC